MTITVLLPVYNGERYLAQAIESILNQTYQDFEFLIIDDGSTDRSREIATRYKNQDARIRTIQHERNLGLVSTLNEGLDVASGDWVARMDADDVCLPNRLETQVMFAQRHPTVGVIGTSIQYIDDNSKLGNVIHYIHDPTINSFWGLLYNPVAHPTAFFKRKIVISVGGFRDTFIHCEDFDLWSRLRTQTLFSNVKAVLLRYRIHSQSVSRSFRHIQSANAREVVWQNVNAYMRCSKTEAEILRTYYNGSLSDLPRALRRKWLLFKLMAHYCLKEKLSVIPASKIFFCLLTQVYC